MYPPLSQFQAQNEDKSLGISTRYVYEKIDWLSVSFPHNIKVSQICGYLPENTMVRIKSPIPVYSLAYSYGAAKILTGHPNSGIHLILSGKPLDNLRMIYNYSMDSIYAMIKELRGKVSRIDFAVDVINDDKFTINEIHRRYGKNQCDTRLKSSKYIGENSEHETFYIGKLNSKSRRFRCYNKSVELGDLSRKWVRVEYEKRRGAMSSYKAFVSGQSIASIIIGAVDFPSWARWGDIFGDAKAIIPRELLDNSDDMHNKIEWVKKSAAGAIATIAFDEYLTGKIGDIHDAEIFTILADSIAAKLREKMSTIIE